MNLLEGHRIVRSTKNPRLTVSRLDIAAIWFGCKQEEAAALILETALDQLMEDMCAEGNPLALMFSGKWPAPEEPEEVASV